MVYDSEELQTFKAAQETKTYKPAVDQTPTNPDNDATALSKFVKVSQPLHLLEVLNHLTDVLKAIREEQEIDRLNAPIHHKLTLSLAEASALSGISRQRLRQAIEDGTLTAQIIDRGYCVKRTDLENYVDSL
jgi:excisionase family DNA binding protein